MTAAGHYRQQARIDINMGLPEIRNSGSAPGDVEASNAKSAPKIMASSAPTAAAASRLSPMSGRKCCAPSPA
jgi:hypothetical protein